jgi:hypothetical protein
MEDEGGLADRARSRHVERAAGLVCDEGFDGAQDAEFVWSVGL